ncbi:MAG: hypothetical protein AB1814_16765 [Thermodesulfobacteriota bacterium]
MKHLSSLVLMLYALGGVVFCLAVGIVMAQVRPYSMIMPSMDHGLILDWLLASLGGKSGSMLLSVWFLALCAAVGVLVLNLCCCAWTKLLPRLQNGTRVHSWLLLLAHVLMILILLGHLSQMTLGFKQEGIKLLPGQSRTLPGDLRIAVEQVHYVNDPKLLNLPYRRARQVHTVAAFDRQKNVARVAVWQGAQRVETAELRILEPLVKNGLRLTLSEFYRDDSQGRSRVGAVLTASHNPLTGLFFAAYLAWVATYLLLTVQAFVRKPPTLGNG